jgi:hypothetical protein
VDPRFHLRPPLIEVDDGRAVALRHDAAPVWRPFAGGSARAIIMGTKSRRRSTCARPATESRGLGVFGGVRRWRDAAN